MLDVKEEEQTVAASKENGHGRTKIEPEKKEKTPVHNTQKLLAWLRDGKHKEITQHFIDVLRYIDGRKFITINADNQYFVDLFVQDMLFVFAQPSFAIPNALAREIVLLNATIANVVAMSGSKTTDAALDIICHSRQSKDNAAKVCALFSARNHKKIDRQKIVAANPRLASYWYAAYFNTYTSALPEKHCIENLREHIRFEDDRLDLTIYQPSDMYYGATYVNHEEDRLLKARINRAYQKKYADIEIKNRPRESGRKRIAVFSDLWRKRHSSYRIQSQFIEVLKDEFHLTLVHAQSESTEQYDMSMFEDSIYIGKPGGGLNVSPILENDFSVAYFSDVGMTNPSIMLANLRIAPVQILGPGHPVSTFGALTDYFFGGADVEVAELAEENYSEELVLLPGLGAIHNSISYEPKGIEPSHDPVYINCAWSPQKTNYEFLCMLRDAIKDIDLPIKFRFFPSSIPFRHAGRVAYGRALCAVLGAEHVEIMPPLTYESYMEKLEEGTLSIDSYPYGGGNIISDSLHVGRPILCPEGTKWYNRMGAAMLREKPSGISSVGIENLADAVRSTLTSGPQNFGQAFATSNKKGIGQSEFVDNIRKLT